MAYIWIRLYYKLDYNRLAACRLVFHQLAHVAQTIRDFGPLPVTWSFVMERYVGVLGRSVRSNLHIARNMANNAFLMTQQRHISMKFDLTEDNKRRSNASMISIINDGTSALLPPATRVELSDAQMRMLLAAYKAIFYEEIKVTQFHPYRPNNNMDIYLIRQ